MENITTTGETNGQKKLRKDAGEDNEQHDHDVTIEKSPNELTRRETKTENHRKAFFE